MLNLSFLIWILFAQDVEPVVREEFRVNYVLLDVVATTKKGRPVEGLSASDFVVEENGEPVEVTYFEILDFRRGEERIPQPPSSVEETAIGQNVQQIIILLDLIELKLFNANKTFKQLEHFLNGLDPEQAYSLALYSLGDGFITRGFVDRPAVIIDILDRFSKGFFDGMRNNRMERSPDQPLLLGGDNSGGYGSRSVEQIMGRPMSQKGTRFHDLEAAFRNCRELFPGSPGRAERCIRDVLDTYIADQTYRTERVIDELETLTGKFKKNEGLKLILFVSPGFVLHSMTAAHELAQAYGLGQSGIMTENAIVMELRNDYRRVFHACIKNRVMIHGFDIYNTHQSFKRSFDIENNGPVPRGITGAFRNFTREMADGPRELADESGGTFHQTNQLQAAMKKVLTQNRFFYVLGYDSPDSGAPGAFRKITVGTKRKGVKLRHRKGYYGN